MKGCTAHSVAFRRLFSRLSDSTTPEAVYIFTVYQCICKSSEHYCFLLKWHVQGNNCSWNKQLILPPTFYPDPPNLDPDFPRDHSITEGETVSLRCVVKASNPFPNITWIKLSDPGKVFPNDINLNLSNVAHDDEGEYRCLAGNGVGGQIWSRVARVKVQSEYHRQHKFNNLRE